MVGPLFFNSLSHQTVVIDPEENLDFALYNAIFTRDLESLKWLKRRFSLSFNNIAAVGSYGIGRSLLCEVKKLIEIYENGSEDNDFVSDFLTILVDHPSASSIQRLQTFEGNTEDTSALLGILLRYCVELENRTMIKTLLHAHLVHLILPNGEYGLGRALVEASCSGFTDIVSALLGHSNAIYLPQKELQVALNLTTRSCESALADKQTIYHLLNTFATDHGITLKVKEIDWYNL